MVEGEPAARAALHYVAPVGEKEAYVDLAMRNIAPYLPSSPDLAQADATGDARPLHAGVSNVGG